ncbi:MAG TPA: hypothetical protein VM432_10585 [Bdellovibrionales bacterium]|nr:hypothetical protein [Bdellovibrionales bacterium]
MNIRPNPCKNLNHGRSNVSIGFCPECGERFDSKKSLMCNTQKHMDYRKQRFVFCIDCGGKLAGIK